MLTKDSLEIRTATLIEMTKLLGHEEIVEEYLEELKNVIEHDGVLKNPIVVDENTNIIIDGHHRFEALKKLGCSKIPAYFIDYESPMIRIETWNNTEPVTKDLVIKSALIGKKFPAKTTKHMINISNHWVHISHIQKEINIPLGRLR